MNEFKNGKDNNKKTQLSILNTEPTKSHTPPSGFLKRNAYLIGEGEEERFLVWDLMIGPPLVEIPFAVVSDGGGGIIRLAFCDDEIELGTAADDNLL